MAVYYFATYVLLMSYNPCDVFKYYNVTEMHGLNLADCNSYNNTNDDAYIAGLSNQDPNDSTKRFVFINLSRCNNDIETMGLVMHEMMHHSFTLHKDEEDIITWAENESYEVLNIINYEKSPNKNLKNIFNKPKLGNIEKQFIEAQILDMEDGDDYPF
jgi:hypothetical protein